MASAPQRRRLPAVRALALCAPAALSTLAATSLMPSITLPCHMSIFHSVPPTRHGITTNIYQPMARPLPGLLDTAHAAGLSTAAIHNWEPLRDLSRPLSLDFSLCRNDCETNPESDEMIADEAIRCIGQDRPELAFVYFGVLDAIGHRHGFMSAPYLAQLERTDAAIGRLLLTLPAETTILLTTDHGGHDRAHGTDLPEDMIVPWLIAGPSFRRDHTIAGPVSLLDTAPTLAHVLDLQPPREWEGRVVVEAFRSA